MEPRKTQMSLHDDVMYQILQWLPVISLLRFKLVCKTWRALIESNNFIKQHLCHHHYDPNLKDKDHNLIYLVTGKNLPLTLPLISIDRFEQPRTCVQLDFSDLRGYFPFALADIVSYNGIVCMNIVNRKLEHAICLWNPATKQSRVLPQLPAPKNIFFTVGFGFDVKNNDYKVVNLMRNVYSDKTRVEVYSLNTSSWRSVTTVISFGIFIGNPKMPFNNGTCFFWSGYNSPEDARIFCFDFCSEMFRSISFPHAGYLPLSHHTQLVSVVHDKIACAFRTNDQQTEIWVFNEYGEVNESWTKLYRIDTTSIVGRQMHIKWVSMNGNYVFFTTSEQMCRFNVVSKETTCFTLEYMLCSFPQTMVEFKESLVSVLDA